jgi:hypothetical protein
MAETSRAGTSALEPLAERARTLAHGFAKVARSDALARVPGLASSDMKKIALLLALSLTSLVHAQATDDPHSVAVAYLDALAGKGDDAARATLLGGVTMTAEMFTLENWQIVSEDPVRTESGDLADVKAKIAALDAAGRHALGALMGTGGDAVGDEMTTAELSEEDAARLLAPTRAKAKALQKAHPIFAHWFARVGKEVYWHPKNPIRPLLAKAPASGKYTVVVHRYNVLSKEGPRQSPRKWPLRVVRFQAGGVDTGWKVLPASDWKGE